MNLFVLDQCPVKAASLQVNKSLVKMCLESAQMLSTAVRQVYQHVEPHDKLYWSSHVNHPWNIWTRETSSNYQFHLTHAKALCAEYTRRFKKRHKSEDVIDYCATKQGYHKEGPLTPMPLCMPDEYRNQNDVVASYVAYYSDKSYVKRERML